MATIEKVCVSLHDSVKEIRELTAKIAEIEGKKEMFSQTYFEKNLQPQLAALHLQLEKARTSAIGKATGLVDDAIAELERADELDGSQLTDDARLLGVGVKLTEKDLRAILDRNRDNATMTQLVQRYAEQHDINLGADRVFVGHLQDIQALKDLKGTIETYVPGWLGLPEADSMIAAAFGYAASEDGEGQNNGACTLYCV